VNLLPRDNAIS